MQTERWPNEDSSRHRLVFSPFLDRLDASKGLWIGDSPPSAREERLHHALRDAVASCLTHKQREAVELFFFEGLSQGDIARKLGVSQQVVQRRIYGTIRRGRRVGGALRKLHEALSPCFAPQGGRSG